jgi:phospholipid/cholesterol/gamma-HCH transport system substrate-binding protein
VESKSNHIVVGSFVLLLVAGLIAFIIWTVKSDVDSITKTYTVYFTGSVSGLNESGSVRYRGIPVGTITDIRIDPKNVDRVQVTLEISGDTPIKEDTVASVEMAGITGVSFVQIAGGTNQSPPLRAARGNKHPIIPSKQSGLQELFSNTPELINRVITLTDAATKLLDQRNRDSIASTLTNVDVLTGTLAANSGNIDLLIADASLATRSLRETMAETNLLVVETRDNLARMTANANKVLNTANETIGVLGPDAQLLIADVRTATASLTRTSDEMGALIAENRVPLKDFTEDGLYEFARLITEMRALVASLSRISEQLEADPAGFLFGDDQEGFEAQ